MPERTGTGSDIAIRPPAPTSMLPTVWCEGHRAIEQFPLLWQACDHDAAALSGTAPGDVVEGAAECLSREPEVLVMHPRRLLVFALAVVVARFIWVRRDAVLSSFAAPSRLAPARQPASAIATGIHGSATRPPMVPGVDGNCPDTHPVKANPTSHIYHLPHQRAYQRLSQAVCFVDAASAEADGYRASKQ